MDAIPGSTIAVLCYARDPAFEFHAVAAELSNAVGTGKSAGRLALPAPGLALCDTDGLRIGLARVDMRHVFPGSLTARHYPTCIVVSVGPGPARPAAAPRTRDAEVHSALIDRVQEHAAPDRVLMFERAGSYDPEIHEAVVDDIRGHLDRALVCARAPLSDTRHPAGARAPAGAARAAPDAAPDAAPRAVARVPDPEDIIQNLASRVDAELARLDRARRAFEQAEATADQRARSTHGMRLVVPRLLPGLPPSTLGLLRIPGRGRAAASAYPDYTHMPANVDERPLLHRAAVNALNVTVMTIALPVGAALLTMAVFGREDMLFSSRVTAVTGVGIGLYNTGVADRLLSLFS